MEEEIKGILANNYGIKDVRQIRHLTDGFANLKYKVETDSTAFVYRICLQKSDAKELEYEVRLSKALDNINFPIAKLIANISNEYITISPAGIVILTEFIEGNYPEPNHSTVKEITIFVAKLNLFENWKSFQRENIIRMDLCPQIIDDFKTAPQQFPEIYKYFEEQTKFFEEPITY